MHWTCKGFFYENDAAWDYNEVLVSLHSFQPFFKPRRTRRARRNHFVSFVFFVVKEGLFLDAPNGRGFLVVDLDELCCRFGNPAPAAVCQFNVEPAFALLNQVEFDTHVEGFLKSGLKGRAVTFSSDDFPFQNHP